MLNDSSDLEFLKKYSEEKQQEIIAFLMKNITRRVTQKHTEGVYIIKNSIGVFIVTSTDMGEGYFDYAWHCAPCGYKRDIEDDGSILDHLEKHHPELLQED